MGRCDGHLHRQEAAEQQMTGIKHTDEYQCQ